ncbi:ABC transporter permease [Spelaeicoccus albus]|uniref:NitT/TauT family transport system permease protein n=1 Tax=Spelaeicoccus albus TaxID=1280376 RepID=A0A7Z0ABV9_9MICO|nr:ABC transporter permease [Spelaeicoccus albus]NYI67338.1 NitT/TauT family transport system permease protein [Spelaeicoccus albus]
MTRRLALAAVAPEIVKGKDEVATIRASGKTTRTTRAARVLAPVVLGIVVLAVWQAVTGSGVVSAYFLPSPVAIAGEFVGQVAHSSLLTFTGRTLVESLAGSALGIIVALPLGYLVARKPLFSAAVEPYFAASQAIPAVALAPLLVLWLGYGLFPIAILCALLVFFPIYVTTVLGLQTLDREVLDAARMDGVSAASMLWYIEFPLAMPSVLAGVRNGLTLSVTGAVVGEFVMGGDGLGLLLNAQRDSVDTVGLFATLVMLSALAIAMYLLVRLFERRVRALVGLTEE